MKPLLRPHFNFRTEPPDSSGEEAMVFASEGRRVRLKGRNFREFVKRVVPLLDGTRTLEEIHGLVTDQFALADLEDALRTLEAQAIVEDAERYPFDAAAVRDALPQISYLREAHPDPVHAMESLARATVAIVGLGAVGASAALSLVASRVGTLRCIDSQSVEPADSFLTQHYFLGDVGQMRVNVIRERAAAINPECRIETISEEINEDADLAQFVASADFVLGASDPGMVSLDYKLNRVCAADGIPWSSARTTGFEGVLGPTIIPGRTGCFICATMRSIACSDHPDEALRHQRFLDRRKRDDSGAREGLAFGSGVMGRLLAQEAFRYLVTGDVALRGQMLVLDFEELTSMQHRVLRVPNCPVCGIPREAET